VPQYALDLNKVYSNLAVTLGRRNRIAEQIEVHSNAIKIAEQLVKEHPNRTEFATSLVDLYENFSGSLYSLDRKEEGIEASTKAVQVLEQIYDKHPHKLNFAPRLASLYNSTGIKLAVSGQVVEAAEMFSKACIVGEELIESGHNALDDLINVATSYRNSGLSQRDLGNHRKSINAYTKSIEIREKLILDHPTASGSASEVVALYNRLVDVVTGDNSHFESLFPYRRLVALETNLIRQISITAKGPARIAASRENPTGYFQALQFIDSVVGHEKTDGLTLFDAAAIYSHAIEAAAKDPELDEDNRHERSSKYESRAMELLVRAKEAGFFDNENGQSKLQSDKLLDPLRERADFKQFIKELEDGQ
jgi:tetratricopeptide (TPR) repeat protein